jgi:hypothetical protein
VHREKAVTFDSFLGVARSKRNLEGLEEIVRFAYQNLLPVCPGAVVFFASPC